MGTDGFIFDEPGDFFLSFDSIFDFIDDLWCFSGSTKVDTKEKGTIPMKELEIGDHVRVSGKAYEPVYSFAHNDPNRVAEFLVINQKLEISGDHMIYLQGGRYVPASKLQIGDVLISSISNEKNVVVESISKKISKGVYAPLTPSGNIFVDNILASSYVTLQTDSSNLMIGNTSTGVSFQWLIHSFEFPHRLYCYHLGKCPGETYSANGISRWADMPLRLGKWGLEQNPWVLLFLCLPFIMLVTAFALIEYFVLSSPALLVMTCVVGLFLPCKLITKKIFPSTIKLI